MNQTNAHKLLFFLALLLYTSLLSAQSYDLSAGIRLGTDWGVSGQVRLPMIDKNFTGEVIIQSSMTKEEGLFTLLGKQHQPILSRRLNLFMGGGLHTGWTDELKGDVAAKNPFGITGVMGVEATFGRLNLSYDFKPAINLSGGSKFIYTQTAITVRHVIAKRYDIFDKTKEKEREKTKRQKKRQKRKDQRIQEREIRGKGRFEFWKKGNG